MSMAGLLLGIAVLYFVHGSLEEFPTAEDHSKVRSVMGLAVAMLAAVEVGLWRLLRRFGRADR